MRTEDAGYSAARLDFVRTKTELPGLATRSTQRMMVITGGNGR